MDVWVSKNPQYETIVELHKGILRILLEIEKTPNKGAKRAFNNKEINSLIDKTLTSKNPIIKLIEPSLFKGNIMTDSTIQATEHLSRSGSDEWNLCKILEALRSNELDVDKAIMAVINEDSDWFLKTGEIYKVDSSVLIYIFSLPLQPFFEDLSRRVQSRLRETWFESYCPVCGRQSVVAKMVERKRYMVCMYCGTEYLTDQFTCVNCGNRDPNTLGFIALEGYPGYELDYCEKCSNYVKVIYPDRIAEEIPQGFEDLFTLYIDDLAKKTGLGLRRSVYL
jgi:hypothetical protein